jgi:hypothetical protein
MTPKILKTGSAEIRAAGVIRTIDPHTPSVQASDISEEDLRFHNFITSGILKSGIIILAVIPRPVMSVSVSIF